MDEAREIVRKMLEESLENFPFGVAYTAVIFEDEGSSKVLEKILYDTLKNLKMEHLLSEWQNPPDYHMTVTLGKLPLHLLMRGDVGSDVEIDFTHIGISDEAIAFKVSGYISKNDIQHVTVLFKDAPSKSKEIVDWKELEEPFSLTGTIREFPNKRPG